MIKNRSKVTDHTNPNPKFYNLGIHQTDCDTGIVHRPRVIFIITSLFMY